MQLSQNDLHNLSNESLLALRQALKLSSENLDRLQRSSRVELQELENQLNSEDNQRFWNR